jgi:hypothetical protein
MWYIGSQDGLTERFITKVNPHQGITELDYTVRQGEVHEPLYFDDYEKAKAALKLFKAWCAKNYGAPQHMLLKNPQIIEVECNAQLNLF